MIAKILPIILLFAYAICVQAQEAIADEETVWTTSEVDNYEISHPENWTMDTSGLMGSTFFIKSPVASSTDAFQENVNLMLQNIAGMGLDLDSYMELTKNGIKAYFTQPEILSSQKINFLGNEAYEISYTGVQGIYTLQFLQYFWLKDDKAYILTLSCEQKEYDTFATNGRKILDSFKIKDTTRQTNK